MSRTKKKLLWKKTSGGVLIFYPGGQKTKLITGDTINATEKELGEYITLFTQIKE